MEMKTLNRNNTEGFRVHEMSDNALMDNIIRAVGELGKRLGFLKATSKDMEAKLDTGEYQNLPDDILVGSLAVYIADAYHRLLLKK